MLESEERSEDRKLKGEAERVEEANKEKGLYVLAAKYLWPQQMGKSDRIPDVTRLFYLGLDHRRKLLDKAISGMETSAAAYFRTRRPSKSLMLYTPIYSGMCHFAGQSSRRQ